MPGRAPGPPRSGPARAPPPRQARRPVSVRGPLARQPGARSPGPDCSVNGRFPYTRMWRSRQTEAAEAFARAHAVTSAAEVAADTRGCSIRSPATTAPGFSPGDPRWVRIGDGHQPGLQAVRLSASARDHGRAWPTNKRLVVLWRQSTTLRRHAYPRSCCRSPASTAGQGVLLPVRLGRDSRWHVHGTSHISV